MLLAIDAGNTNIVFALYEGEKMRGQWRAVTQVSRTADEHAVWLNQLLALQGLSFADLTQAIIATVVPAVLFDLRALCRTYLKCEPMIVGDPALDLGMKANVDRPQSVGADRLCNTVAAHQRYKGAVIVVDFGTATNFDIVAENGDFDGSVIAPGANLSIEALHQAAALLPRVAIHRAQKVIGRDTAPAMQSGVYWGYVGLIDGLITRIKAEYGKPMTVVATGGLAHLFHPDIPAIEHIDPDLTMRGLMLIHARNAVFDTEEGLMLDRNNRDELVFLPLGGSGEIGMNFNAYGFGPPSRRKWIILDCGVLFGREAATPGVDVIMPDIRFLAERAEDVLGIIATHAHEDHIGAIAPLWPMLKCPIYATPFTAALIEGKLEEAGISARVKKVPVGGSLTLGPFQMDFISITHSILEPNLVAIRTPLGVIAHTGDWKLDPDPLLGEQTDAARIQKLGDEGVLALVCDSTNALQQGHSGSEAKVRDSLTQLIGTLKRRVAVTAFASNVARLDSIAHAARIHGRRIALVGRSMHKIVGAAKDTGYLKDFPPVLDEAEAAELPAGKVLYLCTGSQGEPRAALARIAEDNHPNVHLGKGDAVIFSSRIIPGNELPIFELQNKLCALGVEVLTELDHFVHVSGHPAREELSQMYRWTRPRIAVPVHGELRHMSEHARLAKSLQVPEALVPANGQLYRLAPGPAELIDEVPSGRIHLDGRVLVAEGEGLAKSRRAMAYAGLIAITLVLDGKGRVMADPAILIEGIPAPVQEAVRLAVEELTRRHKRGDSEDLAENVRKTARRAAHDAWGKKPVTRVTVVET